MGTTSALPKCTPAGDLSKDAGAGVPIVIDLGSTHEFLGEQLGFAGVAKVWSAVLVHQLGCGAAVPSSS